MQMHEITENVESLRKVACRSPLPGQKGRCHAMHLNKAQKEWREEKANREGGEEREDNV